MSEAVCLECGRVSVRLQPDHIPHICEQCLAPGRRVAPRAAGPPAPHWTELLEMLHTAVRQAKPYWSSRGFEGWDG